MIFQKNCLVIYELLIWGIYHNPNTCIYINIYIYIYIYDLVTDYLESWIFSENKYFGAPGGPNLMIFAIMVHDPLYFEIGIFSGPPDPPYMSENAQMC